MEKTNFTCFLIVRNNLNPFHVNLLSDAHEMKKDLNNFLSVRLVNCYPEKIFLPQETIIFDLVY